MVVEIEPRRERCAGAGESYRTVAKLRFQAIECCMQVTEKRRVLRVDLICIHGHDSDVVMFAFDRPGQGTLLHGW
jgi:hypothetical protein